MIYVFVSSMGMAQIDVGGWLRIVALRLDEVRLQVDDIFPQRIVLRLDRLEIVLQIMQLSHSRRIWHLTLDVALFLVVLKVNTDWDMCC